MKSFECRAPRGAIRPYAARAGLRLRCPSVLPAARMLQTGRNGAAKKLQPPRDASPWRHPTLGLPSPLEETAGIRRRLGRRLPSPHYMQNTRVPFQAGGWQRRNRNSLLSHGGSFVLPELHSRSEKRPVLEQSIANRFLQPGRRAARPICGASEGTGWRRSRGHVICSQRWIDWVGS